MLPGIETIVTQGKLGTGREIFELACTSSSIRGEKPIDESMASAGA